MDDFEFCVDNFGILQIAVNSTLDVPPVLISAAGALQRVDTNPVSAIKQLLKVDVAEAYSPPRVTLEEKKFGLKPGEAWDLTNGWDFTIEDHRKKAEEYIDNEKPLVLIGSPPCTPFSQLQSLNPRAKNSERKWKGVSST